MSIMILPLILFIYPKLNGFMWGIVIACHTCGILTKLKDT